MRASEADTVEALLARMRRLARECKRLPLTMLLTGGVTCALVWCSMAIYALITRSALPPVHSCWMGIGVGAVSALSAWKKRREEATRALVQFDDVRAVGPLAQAFYEVDAETRPMIKAALLRLLPQLKASDAALLDATQRRALYRMLNPDVIGRDEADFLIALLKALEQVGDEAGIPHVERLIKRYAASESEKRVQAQARESLSFLQQSGQRLRSSQTLLRAGQPSEAGAETLLRPAAETTEAHPEQLLRAGLPEE